MTNSGYIELHARSAFSFLRGASHPETLAEAAADNGLPAIALCDRDGVYGTARLHHTAREHGVRAIVGAELTLEDESVLPVLVENPDGYHNLCRLITRAKLRAPKGKSRVRWDELPEFAGGLIALTGDEEGPLRRAWETAGPNAAADALDRLQSVFPGDRLYAEIQRHLVRGEDVWNRTLTALAASRHVPLLATNGVAHAYSQNRPVFDVFTCLRHKTTLDSAGLLLSPNAERHVKSARAMARLFPDLPEALANTVRLAERLTFSLENLGYRFPSFQGMNGSSMDAFLRNRTWDGARQRYRTITPDVRRQLEHELDIICRLGFSGYFLIVWDLVNFCRDENIMVQGRGSAANSAVCYSLGITAVDPVGSKLLFERFLSENRTSWPDIDLDLPSGDRRERVIQEVYRLYGRHGAAMTANVITYRGRSTVREVGKVLGFPEELLDRFSTLYGHGDYPHTLELKEQLSQAGIPARHPRAPALVSLCRAVHGLPRHLGQHSGGMIICQGQLDTVVPLENASMPGRVVAQWDKDDCEDLGIIKVDLLGLGMMSVLQDTLELTRLRGHPVDLAHIPKDDAETFRMLQNADTIGVFQVESRAQMATLPRMKPKEFYDIVIEVAIIRPGPIQGNLVNPYLERRAGRQVPRYLDPRLEPVLKRTLGVPLFQEQVLKIAMVMADFSGSEAEELRRALSFHRSQERMDKVKVKLHAAMERKGIAETVMNEIIASIDSFALYGFPESHAISFALLAYASAYLKCHRSAEFFVSLLNNQPMGFYSAATLIQDARRHGLRTRPACVTASDWDCLVEDDRTVRLGFRSVRGVRMETVRQMLATRKKRPFDSLKDFLLRTTFNREEQRALAAVGALNVFTGDRRSALWQVETSVEKEDLFSTAVADEADVSLSPLEKMTYLERIQADFRRMNLTTGIHPIKFLRPHLRGICPAAELECCRNGQFITIGGAVICRQRPGTAKGFVFISLEDETGIANAVVEPALFEKRRLTIIREAFLAISGQLQVHDGVIHIKARKIEPLQQQTTLPPTVSHDFC